MNEIYFSHFCLEQCKYFNTSDLIVNSSSGTAGQALVVNSGATALEFQTIQASEITTVGNVFSNYNEISSNTTITTTTTKNSVLFGTITVSGSAILTIAGSGEFRIL